MFKNFVSLLSRHASYYGLTTHFKCEDYTAMTQAANYTRECSC